MWSWWSSCPALFGLGLVLSSASTTQAYFVLRFPILRWVSTLLFIGILQGIAAGIGTFNFPRATFTVSLSSLSFGSMKNIPLNSLALSSFSLSMAHLCFAFFFAASDICFHISGHTLSGLEVVCFLVSLHPDHVSLMLFGLLAGTLARLRDAPRGDSPFHPKQTSSWKSLSSGPSAHRNTFSVSTITDGYARAGGRSTLSTLT